MLEGERDKLLRMEDESAQARDRPDIAVKAVANAVRRARAGLNDEDGRLGSSCSLGQPAWAKPS